MRSSVVAVMLAFGVGFGVPLVAQAPTPAVHPSFAGTWVPANKHRNDLFFAAMATDLPGDGRLIIEQTATLITVTKKMPDEELQRRVRFGRSFSQTVVYQLNAPGRSGGFGAAGAPPMMVPTWVGDRLVIPHAQPDTDGLKNFTVTYSFEGDSLKQETHWELADGRANTLAFLFERSKEGT
jgi:hypothetical protein